MLFRSALRCASHLFKEGFIIPGFFANLFNTSGSSVVTNNAGIVKFADKSTVTKQIGQQITWTIKVTIPSTVVSAKTFYMWEGGTADCKGESSGRKTGGGRGRKRGGSRKIMILWLPLVEMVQLIKLPKV